MVEPMDVTYAKARVAQFKAGLDILRTSIGNDSGSRKIIADKIVQYEEKIEEDMLIING